MTYNGENIGLVPKLALIEVYIAEKGLYIEPQEVYNYWENKSWLTKKGKPVQTLEVAVNVYNSIVMQRSIKTEKENKAQEKKTRKNARKIESKLKIENIKKKPYVLYSEQLKDNRWKAFRLFVLKVRGRRCEICGSEENLQVHHLTYKNGSMAWEYTCNDVIVVCRECHKKLHNK